MANSLCPRLLFTDESFRQEECIGPFIEPSDDHVIYQKNRDLELAVFVDERAPQIALRNCCDVAIPFQYLTADLDIQRPETTGDLDRFRGADRPTLDIVIGVRDSAPREKLPRVVARRSPRAAVQHDVNHEPSRRHR
jgi:hypothetical protein